MEWAFSLPAIFMKEELSWPGIEALVQALRVARACPERSEGSRHDGVRLDEVGAGRMGVAAGGVSAWGPRAL